MKIYNYGHETKVFCGNSEANIDPKKTTDAQAKYNAEKNVIEGMAKLKESEKEELIDKLTKPKKHYLIPANATTIKPPVVEEGELPVFENEKWVVKKNLIGKLFHFSDQEETFKVIELGDLPEGAIEGEKPKTKEQKWDAVRAERTSKLSETDYMILPDSPLSGSDQTKIMEYRQKLRDVPQNNTDPDNITWPTR